MPHPAADLPSQEDRATHATRRAAVAFERLLRQAEEGASGQTPRIAAFVAGAYNGAAFPFDLYHLRCVDLAISDDMLTCLDALRWARADLHILVYDGDARVQGVIARWGLCWPEVQ